MKRNNFSGPIMALITMGFVIYIWKKIVDALFDEKVYVAEPADEENQATDDDDSIANATTGMADEAVQPEEQCY